MTTPAPKPVSDVEAARLLADQFTIAADEADEAYGRATAHCTSLDVSETRRIGNLLARMAERIEADAALIERCREALERVRWGLEFIDTYAGGGLKESNEREACAAIQHSVELINEDVDVGALLAAIAARKEPK
jgi:hypothetical protein